MKILFLFIVMSSYVHSSVLEVGGFFYNQETETKIRLICGDSECSKAYFFKFNGEQKETLSENLVVPMDHSRDSHYDRHTTFYVLRDRLILRRTGGAINPWAIWKARQIHSKFVKAVKIMFSQDEQHKKEYISLTKDDIETLAKIIREDF